jgi:WD40 repeat protein
MVRAPWHSVSSLLVLGLLLLLPAQGADDKDQTKNSSPPSANTAAQAKGTAPAAQKAQTAKKPGQDGAAAKPKAAQGAAKSSASQPAAAAGAKPVSFMKDVAPILVENCIACHNPRKSESKYVMTTFAQLAKGGQQGEGMTLEPGQPDESNLVELIRPGGEPRMPYKQPPLSAQKIATIERWVAEGAKYDGSSPNEDWTILLRKTQPVTIPAAYPVTVPITALQFSRDGSVIAASGYHEITFWKAADGTLVRRQSGLAERVYGIASSPDGKLLAAASGDPGIFGMVKLWPVEPSGSSKPARELVETQDVVFAAVFSPDGKKIATAGADRTIRVFEVDTGKLLAQVEDHADWILAIAFSPDGKRLASASRDKTCKVFDLERKESLVTFPGHAQPVYTISFAPDGKTVATGGEDNRIRLWNPDSDGKQVREIGYGGIVFQLRFTPDGQTLAACCSDKIVYVSKANGSQMKKLSGHKDWVYSLAISHDGKTLASGSWDGEVRLWNLADGKFIRSFIAAPGYKPAATQAALR